MLINKLKRLLLNVISKFNITYSFIMFNFVVWFGTILSSLLCDSGYYITYKLWGSFLTK